MAQDQAMTVHVKSCRYIASYERRFGFDHHYARVNMLSINTR